MSKSVILFDSHSKGDNDPVHQFLKDVGFALEVIAKGEIDSIDCYNTNVDFNALFNVASHYREDTPGIEVNP